MPNNLLNHALFYQKQGLPVFPVSWDDKHEKRKKPLVKWTDFQTRIPTEDEVKEWWTKWPDAGIGMATGQLSGFVVLDAEAESDFSTFGLETAETPTAKSGGGGRHWYFQYEPLKNATNILNDKKNPYDFRGDGGYILLPPSPHESGNLYEWLTPLGSTEPMAIPAQVRKLLEGSRRKVSDVLTQKSHTGTRSDNAATVAGSLLRRYKPSEWEEKAWPLFRSWWLEQVEQSKGDSFNEQELRSVFESISGIESGRRGAEENGITIHRDPILPEVMEEGEDIFITIKTPDGDAIFVFKEIEQSRSDELNCVLTTQFRAPGGTPIPFGARINILSLSARRTYASGLEKCFGKGIGWDLLLSRASETARNTLNNRGEITWVGDAPLPVGSKFLIEPFLVDGVSNLLFGLAGSMKSLLAVRMAISLTTGIPFLGNTPTRKLKVLYLDYEATGIADFRDRIERIISAPQAIGEIHDVESIYRGIAYMKPTAPLAEYLPTLKREIARNDIGFLIIDSAGGAGGGRPEEAEVALRFFSALNRLGIPSLTIHHENRSQDHTFAFGSIYFYNMPRNIWNIRKDDTDGDQSVAHIGLFHRKANDGPIRPFIPLRVFYGDKFTEFNFDGVDRWEEEMTVPRRIIRAIRSKSMTIDELCAELLGIKKTVIKTNLSRLKNRGKIVDENGYWRNIGE